MMTRPEDRLRQDIHDFLDFAKKVVDGRAKPGHDVGKP
jgi:hypothetical protein